MTELGKEVFMTSQAVKNRIARLQDLGVVERYTVNVNCPLFGYTKMCIRDRFLDESLCNVVPGKIHEICSAAVWHLARLFLMPLDVYKRQGL